MNFVDRKTPLVSTSENSYKRLISYHIAVYFMVVLSLVLQAAIGFREFVLGFSHVVIVVVVSSCIVAIRLALKKKPLYMYRDYMGLITYALLTALLLPTESPFYIFIIAVLLMDFIRAFFDKVFRKNIIHPVLLSILFIHIIFGSYLPISLTMSNIFQEETLNFGPIRFLFGVYQGLTLGSSAFIVLLFLWIYLSVAKVIQLKMSLFYLLNLIGLVLYYGFFTEISLWESFTKILIGYSVFMLVFFIAEPTSTPETKEVAWIYSLLAAFLTAWFRIQFNLIEAAIYAVIFAQLTGFILEQFQQRTNPLRARLVFVSILLLWGIMITIAML
ncbi:MAG: RnfABCDGE type electron transport complex subunit D [Candidatus Izemoplasmataceae bacterium]